MLDILKSPFIFFITLWIIGSCVFANNVHAMDLRIRIAQSKRGFTIEGKDLIYKSSIGKNKSSKLGSIKIVCPRGKKEPGVYFEIESKKKKVRWKNQDYPGRFLVSIDPRGRCELINELDLEDYITMVISKEMHPSWPIESLKAQAVAARTYAIDSMLSGVIKDKLGYKPPYHMINSQLFQVNSSWSDVRLKALAAIDQTRGEILVDDKGKIIPLFYHSKCGGRTLTPDKVWGKKIAGYQSVSCPFCHGHGKRDWGFELSNKKVERIINKLQKRRSRKLASKSVNLLASNFNDNRVRFELDQLNKDSVKKEKLRQAIGGDKAFSNYFKLIKQENGFEVKGKGHGHRVGLCQFGAYEMAKRKRKYKDILSYYYPRFKTAHMK